MEYGLVYQILLGKDNVSSLFDDELVKSYALWLGKEACPPKSFKKHPVQSAEDLEAIKTHFQEKTGISLGKYIRVKRVNALLHQEQPTQNPLTVHYVDTPLGAMVMIFTGKGLCLLEFVDRRMLETELKSIQQQTNGSFRFQKTAQAAQLENQLTEYFNKNRKEFFVALDLLGTDFQKVIWTSLLEVSYGQTTTYKDQAVKYGNPNAVRAVAGANGKNRIAVVIPCHRVVGSDGTLVGYSGGLDRKEALLSLEGAIADKLL